MVFAIAAVLAVVGFALLSLPGPPAAPLPEVRPRLTVASWRRQSANMIAAGLVLCVMKATYLGITLGWTIETWRHADFSAQLGFCTAGAVGWGAARSIEAFRSRRSVRRR